MDKINFAGGYKHQAKSDSGCKKDYFGGKEMYTHSGG
jgi:hypothetical protein